jgi:uncharacterized protein with HEPN domain
MLEAIQKIIYRFGQIEEVSDFTNSQFGMEKLDSICMLLIAIGESLKNIDKITGKALLQEYPEIDWKGAKGLRDIIVHQYFDVDAEEIFWICEKHIPSSCRNNKKDNIGFIIRINKWSAKCK